MCVCYLDRQIRHRACALKDTVHAIIRAELDEDFEKICEELKVSRRARGEYMHEEGQLFWLASPAYGSVAFCKSGCKMVNKFGSS